MCDQTDARVLQRYGVAVLATVLAFGLTRLIRAWLDPTLFPLFFVAVVASACFGGLGPGLLSTSLAVTANVYFFLTSPSSLDLSDILARLGLFMLAVVVTGLLIEAVKTGKRALQRERNFVSSVLETVGSLVVVLDRGGRIVRFNRACEQLTGYCFDEVRGQCIWDLLLLAEEVASVKAVFAELVAGHFPNDYENYWVASDGRRRLIAWSNTALLASDGTIEYVIGTGIDITERRQAEEALRESETKLQLIAAQLPAHVWTTDTDLRVTSVLGAGLARLGVDKSLYVGKTLHDLRKTSSDRRLQPIISAHLRAVEGGAGEYEIEVGDRLFDARVEPLRDGQDRIVRCVGLAFDVTEPRQAERQLVEVRRRLAESREAERLRLAQELHDGVVQQLITLSYRLAEERRGIDGAHFKPERIEALGGALDSLRQEVLNVVQRMRRVIKGLRPAGLKDLGLTAALGGHLAELKRESGPEMPEISAQLDESGTALPWPIALCLFSVAQEALRNAVRHAQATQIGVRLHLQPTEVFLGVCDDGRGFDTPSHTVQLIEGGHLV